MKLKSIIIEKISKGWFVCISEVPAPDLGQSISSYGFIKMDDSYPVFVPKDKIDFNDLSMYFDSYDNAYWAADIWIWENIPTEEQ